MWIRTWYGYWYGESAISEQALGDSIRWHISWVMTLHIVHPLASYFVCSFLWFYLLTPLAFPTSQYRPLPLLFSHSNRIKCKYEQRWEVKVLDNGITTLDNVPVSVVYVCLQFCTDQNSASAQFRKTLCAGICKNNKQTQIFLLIGNSYKEHTQNTHTRTHSHTVNISNLIANSANYFTEQPRKNINAWYFSGFIH